MEKHLSKATLLAAGTKGKRYALPNSEIMLHPALGGAQGQATEVEIAAKHILKVKDKMNHILAKHTAKRLKEWNKTQIEIFT